MNPDYLAFLASKAPKPQPRGFEPSAIRAQLFDYQRFAVEKAIRLGRSALFLDTGLGKTVCELEFANQCFVQTGKPSLLLTPLAVARQIEREAARFGYQAAVIRNTHGIPPPIAICNYDRLDMLDCSLFGAVVLDESSILQAFAGKTTTALIDAFRNTPYRMAATATPAPNDHTELGNHAEFLGIMENHEMLLRWFINDTNDTGTWRLKGHAVKAFWDWVAAWAIMAETPEDLGFDGSKHVLPALHIQRHKSIGTAKPAAGDLFAADVSATTMYAVKRETAAARAVEAAVLVNGNDKPWLIWCDMDAEADALHAVIPNAGEVRGSMRTEEKEDAIECFQTGNLRVLIGKPQALGYGLNFQHCADMIFVGRSFSYKAWYQAVRRCWRFGQKRPVNVHIIVAEGEDQIGRVISTKAEKHDAMKQAMREANRRASSRESQVRIPYNPTAFAPLPKWME